LTKLYPLILVELAEAILNVLEVKFMLGKVGGDFPHFLQPLIL
jgi:hypothetical protein